MKLFSGALLDELSAQATASTRGRANHNVHASADDPVQRFFIVANRHSYFRPHRHRTKSELALILRGSFDVITFDASGCVRARYIVGAGGQHLGYETPRDTWHTLIARDDGAAFLEIKEGPYDQATAAEFAPWAPPEGDARVPQFLEWLRTAAPGMRARD
ncbi:MAG TPA: WbuC family cupin fold metalloprotein [Steroidobacteraceae bacterium]|jgi:cupin fold WbuC family metalloprotein|nr:WbuC family cupin fold metalloprotein [Steroidobacteraceae bacterium]